MLLFYVLGSFKKFKEAIFLLLISLVFSVLFQLYSNQYSYFLIFNYFSSIIYLVSRLVSKKSEDLFETNTYPISYITNYVLFCFFLIWYIVTLFQMYISLSIFDINHSEHLSLIFLFAIQSRMLFYDNKSKTQIVINILDLVFVSSFLFLRSYETYLTIIIYFYSFRLFRVLTLVPYFDKILSSIWRGFRISFHFVIAFFLIILLLSINSRILFSKKSRYYS